ncbi:uncharacterized protein AlacWU_00753 [Aspergillus niger]|nr:uncharacterized protein AlacWU_00753 [Aspergillus niger]
MDHKIDTLATLHNWTQGTPSLYPFTGIIQLCLAEEISVATAVEEISAFINGKGEGIDECVHDLWASILHTGRCLPSTNIISAIADPTIPNGNGSNAKKETIDTDISTHQTPTPPQKKLIALMHAIKNMPDVHVHIRTRAQSRYSWSSSSQMYSAIRDRYSFYSNTNENITEKNENEPTNEENNNGKEDEGESTEEEELYHPSLGVYLDGTVGGSPYLRHLHDSVSTPAPSTPAPPLPTPVSSEPKKNTNEPHPQPHEKNRPKPPKLPSSASDTTIRPTKTKSLVWAYLPQFKDVVESIFHDFGKTLGTDTTPFPHIQPYHQPPHQPPQKIHPKDQQVLYQAWINFITFLAFLAREGVLRSPDDLNSGYEYGFDEFDWGFNDNNNIINNDFGDGVGSWIDDLAISCLRVLNNNNNPQHQNHQHQDEPQDQDHNILQTNTQILTATTLALLYGEHLWRRRGDRSHPSPPTHQQQQQEKIQEKEKKEEEKENYIVAGLTLDEFESGSVSASTSTSAANSPPLASSPQPQNTEDVSEEGTGRFITRKLWESWIRRFNELAGDLGMEMGLWDETREGAWLAGEELRRVCSVHHHHDHNSSHGNDK